MTATDLPGYLTAHVDQFSNDSAADIAAMEWIGANLPSCSRVLAATDSVGHLLPEFASVHLIATDAYVRNLSYNQTVDDLYSGIYDNSTRAAMLEIEVTEVLVTGRTSVSVPGFNPSPLENSTDFVELFHQQDAWVFMFNPGVLITGCTVPLPP